MTYARRGENALGEFNKKILDSPGYKSRVQQIRNFLSDQMFLTDEEIDSLGIDQRFRTVPFKMVVGLVHYVKFHARKNNYGFNLNEDIKVWEIAEQIEDLEDMKVPKESMTPLQSEYISLWASELQQLFLQVSQMKSRFGSTEGLSGELYIDKFIRESSM